MTSRELPQERTSKNVVPCSGAKPKNQEQEMTRGLIAATAALITFAFAAPAMAQEGGCWKSTDSTKMYGYTGACPTPAKQTRRPSRVDEKGTQSNAMQVSVNAGGPGQCWKGTDSTKSYGYWHACN
jgi:hypothetical protein